MTERDDAPDDDVATPDGERAGAATLTDHLESDPGSDNRELGLRPLLPAVAGVGAIATAAALTDAASMAGLAVLLTGGLVEATTPEGTTKILSNPLVILALVIASFVLSAVVAVIRERITARWDAARRTDLIVAYQEADFATQSEYSGGALGVVTEQITRASIAIAALAGLINNVVRTLIYMVVAFIASWQVSGIAIATGAVLVLGLRQLSRRTRAMHRQISGQTVEIGGHIGEMAAASRELHILNRWGEIVGFLRSEIDQLREVRFRSSAMAGLVGPVYQAGSLLVALAIGILAGNADGAAATQRLAASALLLVRALTAAQTAQVQYQQYNDSRPYVERVGKVVAGLRRHRRRTGTTVPTPPVHLDVDGVSLSHGNDVIVRGLDLHFEGVGGVALIGPSGSGKSTTTVALAGLLDPVEGSILAGGVPLGAIPAEDLGRIIGLLPQDPKLLRATLRSNVARPETGASDEDVLRALKAVGLDQTVEGFDASLDTQMGREGEGFSGGELQRLGLARLLVNQPDVWLLDEPTSALDRENSERVAQIITTAMEEHLVIVVTHRPDLLHHCRRIIYMEAGAVVDDGPLDEVAARQPFVASMLQSGPSDAPSDPDEA